MTRISRAIFLLTFALLVAYSTQLAAGQPAYDLAFSVEPAVAGVYSVHAKVTDLATKAVVSGAVLKVAADEPASSETVLPDGQTKVRVSVTLDSGLHKATYSIEVRRANEILASSSATLPMP